MRVSISWLKEFIDFKWTIEELEEKLASLGFSVESREGDVLDLEITANRGDCLSILGIAREIAAITISNLKSQISKIQLKTEKLDKEIKVEIAEPKLCPRFTARIIDGIKIGESPKWMQKRLASYGFRPINNIVDVTNYVMLELGQPLHAFDYDKIKNGLIRIQRAKSGERLVTLDGQTRTLDEDAIIIEDDEKIYDLAGIMGGKNSEVDEKTKTIILQGAIFDRVLIRRASKKLNYVTDASYRYERGVDYEGTIYGIDTAATLIQELIKNAKIGKLIDIKKQTPSQTKIKIEENKINRLLGVKIPFSEMEKYLTSLGFKIEDKTAIVPSWRFYDVKIWQDLAEEIARMYGYWRLPKTTLSKQKPVAENKDWTAEQRIKDCLTNLGFTEIESYPYLSAQDLKNLGFNPNDCLEIANPLSFETQYLRPSLLPPILKQIAKNPWAPEIKIFEIGKVFGQKDEWWQLGIAVVGKNDQILTEAKSKLKIVAEIKSIDQKILDIYKIRRPVKYILVDLKKIRIKPQKYHLKISKDRYQSISKFPPTIRDLAFIVDLKIRADEIAEAIKSVSEKIFLVELFDEFASEKLGHNKKNLAFHIWLQDMKRPMEEKELGEIIGKIVKTIERKFQAKLRS